MCALAALAAGCVDYGPGAARVACQELLEALGRQDALACENLAASVASGAVAFFPDRQPACLEEARAATPPGLLTPGWLREHLPACAQLFSGRRRVGEGCRANLECPDGAYCDAGGDDCPGTCRAYAARGETCGARASCDPARDACRLTCAALSLEGEACGASQTCAPGLTCVEGGCLGPQAEGGPCALAAAFGRGCAAGLFCAGDDTCRRPAPEGGGCLSRSSLLELLELAGLGLLRYDQCAPGLACLEGACAAPRAAGEGCAPDDWPACAEGLGCHPETRTCGSLRPVGGTCEPGGLACEAGAFCARSAGALVGTCAPLGAGGESCAGPFECAPGLTCRGGACAADRCHDFLTPTLASATARPAQED